MKFDFNTIPPHSRLPVIALGAMLAALALALATIVILRLIERGVTINHHRTQIQTPPDYSQTNAINTATNLVQRTK